MHKIQKYLEKENLTQEFFSRYVGIHVNTLYNYIHCIQEPKLSIAMKIQRATENEITVQDLAEEWENRTENKSSA